MLSWSALVDVNLLSGDQSPLANGSARNVRRAMSSHRAYDAPNIAGPWVPDPILSEKRFDAPRVADQRLVSRSDEPTCLRRLVTLGMRAEH